jgi:hypothetical protein
MSTSQLTDVDIKKAQEIWTEYQKQHDVSDRTGRAVGIDPVTGRIWFGERALDIADQLPAEGIDRPFYCVRVGRDYYLRKGGHRDPRHRDRRRGANRYAPRAGGQMWPAVVDSGFIA